MQNDAPASLESLLEIPATDPAPLYAPRDAIYAVDLIAAAVVHFDFFTWLADHPSTPGAISVHFGFHIRPLDVLLTLTHAMGLTTQAGGVVHATLRAREHFNAASPWNVAPYYAALRDRPQTLDMVKVLRTGKPANWGSFDASAWAESMKRQDFAESFTAAMDCRGIYLGALLAQKINLSTNTALLDVAGGSGIYACALAAKFPQLRTAVFERPPVDEVARRAIAKRGGADRVEVIAGDMFTDAWPAGFDAILLSNVIHDWDEPEVRQLFRRAADALPSGGRLLLHDAFLNAEKNGPLYVAQYSVLLMSQTEGRCFGTGEMRSWLADLGLDCELHEPTGLQRSVMSFVKN